MIENLPYGALRAFEAAARHLSFKQAAAELHVTPAAISQQIKTLEHLLGVKLFHRKNRGLSLTPCAEAGLKQLRGGFGQIEAAVQQMRNASSVASLTIWSAPTFAAKWLVPRLHRFSEQYPGVDLNISANIDLIDTSSRKNTIPAENFRRNKVDIAIRFGSGSYPGCRVRKLFSVSALPVCAPKLLRGKQPLRSPEDLRHHTLLHEETPYEGRPKWSNWLKAAGIDDIDPKHGIRFSSSNLALTAAIDGQGVALSTQPLAGDDIAAGRLVVPFDIELPIRGAYYVITLEDQADSSEVEAFRGWLIAESAQMQK